jgi:hypothetical protein
MRYTDILNAHTKVGVAHAKPRSRTRGAYQLVLRIPASAHVLRTNSPYRFRLSHTSCKCSPYQCLPELPSPTNRPIPTNTVPPPSKSSAPRSLSHLFACHASPSHPRPIHPIISLSCARAQDRASAKRRHVPPNGLYSRENDWWETPALGPRVSKLAPFLREFSKLPKEATERESAPSGHLRSCMSRFSSVSSGDSVSSPGSPGKKTVPFCAT